MSCTTEGTDEKEVIFYFEVSTLFVVNNLEQTQNASTVIGSIIYGAEESILIHQSHKL
ncbi:TPA: hypothetical protein LY401_001906 [Enterococcus faecium]|nr:hypothetical protein [Enterococcus faecium]HBM5638634.1 hypothetical protein [Enterococcus faecium]HBM5650571.1 hypothetical protein [Enterococcus faecium]HBM5653169.1 hypothetical protein [Enterococcus faecium]HBM6169405.1 hypothetical protein [Enterococcus faecium]